MGGRGGRGRWYEGDIVADVGGENVCVKVDRRGETFWVES